MIALPIHIARLVGIRGLDGNMGPIYDANDVGGARVLMLQKLGGIIDFLR